VSIARSSPPQIQSLAPQPSAKSAAAVLFVRSEGLAPFDWNTRAPRTDDARLLLKDHLQFVMTAPMPAFHELLSSAEPPQFRDPITGLR